MSIFAKGALKNVSGNRANTVIIEMYSAACLQEKTLTLINRTKVKDVVDGLSPGREAPERVSNRTQIYFFIFSDPRTARCGLIPILGHRYKYKEGNKDDGGEGKEGTTSTNPAVSARTPATATMVHVKGHVSAIPKLNRDSGFHIASSACMRSSMKWSMAAIS